MGAYCHHGIMVTGQDSKVMAAWLKAKSIFGFHVSDLINSEANGFQSFFIPPDGSKEGWDRSDRGDIKRMEFTTWLIKNQPGVAWVEVAYGNELGEDAIIDTSNQTRRKEKSDHDET